MNGPAVGVFLFALVTFAFVVGSALDDAFMRWAAGKWCYCLKPVGHDGPCDPVVGR